MRNYLVFVFGNVSSSEHLMTQFSNVSTTFKATLVTSLPKQEKKQLEDKVSLA